MNAELLPEHRLAANALANAQPLQALNAVARSKGPHALALRGLALAQLLEFADARADLERAARAFQAGREQLHAARALAAAGEVAAAQRDFGAADRLLVRAARLLAGQKDRRNLAWVLAVHARSWALRGDLARAQALLHEAQIEVAARTDAASDPWLALTQAELLLRRLDVPAAQEALSRLVAELGRPFVTPLRGVDAVLRGEALAAADALEAPLAHLVRGGRTLALDAGALARVMVGRGARAARFLGARRWLLLDHMTGRILWPGPGPHAVTLGRRPVLWALSTALERSWPLATDWRTLAAAVFGISAPDESVRRRCAVEIDRLRRLLPAPVRVVTERHAWRIELPRGSVPAQVRLAGAGVGRGPQLESRILAALTDGVAWSAPALAQITRQSTRSVQRALLGLTQGGLVVRSGQARARRYAARSPAGIACQVLLAALLMPARAAPA